MGWLECTTFCDICIYHMLYRWGTWKYYATTPPRISRSDGMHATTASFRLIHHIYVKILDIHNKQLDVPTTLMKHCLHDLTCIHSIVYHANEKTYFINAPISLMWDIIDHHLVVQRYCLLHLRMKLYLRIHLWTSYVYLAEIRFIWTYFMHERV